MSHLGDLLRDARQRAGLSVKDVAVRTGLRNVAKQIRVLQRLEEGRDPFPKAIYVQRFAEVLGVDLPDVVQAMGMDYDEYEKWCNTPVKPYLVVRAIPGFYLHQSLPEGCTMDEAMEAAWRIVREKGFRVALVFKRGRAIYFQRDAEPFEGETPTMQIGRTGRQEMARMKHACQVPVERPKGGDGEDAGDQEEN